MVICCIYFYYLDELKRINHFGSNRNWLSWIDLNQIEIHCTDLNELEIDFDQIEIYWFDFNPLTLTLIKLALTKLTSIKLKFIDRIDFNQILNLTLIKLKLTNCIEYDQLIKLIMTNLKWFKIAEWSEMSNWYGNNCLAEDLWNRHSSHPSFRGMTRPRNIKVAYHEQSLQRSRNFWDFHSWRRSLPEPVLDGRRVAFVFLGDEEPYEFRVGHAVLLLAPHHVPVGRPVRGHVALAPGHCPAEYPVNHPRRNR